MMHPKYLPFTEEQLLTHFAAIRQNGKCIKNIKHLEYYKESINKYKKDLEGLTNVDALLINLDNGFSVIIEAKVLSDISCQVTYDVMRNQIARNIDVMLEGKNDRLCFPLNKRDPEKTLFLLLTPKIFKDTPTSRLYGYKFNEHKNNPYALANSLIYREKHNWTNISMRLGWLTWEDLNNINHDCCKWLKCGSIIKI